MARVPPAVLPRDVDPSRVSNPDVPAGALQRAQGGPLQARDFDRAGRSWREEWPHLSPRVEAENALLARLRWLRARAKFFWAEHPNLPGSGVSIRGSGRENLAKNADLSSGTSGVADDWSESGDTGQVTFSIV